MSHKKIKVLQIGKYYPPVRGGIETHLEMLCQGLQASGEVDLEVIVASESSTSKEEVVDGVPVHRLGTAIKIAGAPVCPGMRRAIREAKADIVHIHTPHPTAILTYLLSGAAERLVCTYHSDIIRQKVLGKIIGPLQNLAFQRAGAIVAASPNLIDASPVLTKHRDRCVVVPFGTGLPADDCPEQPIVEELRAKHPGPIVLAVGRLVYYKGFEHLIRAMALAKAPGTLLIIGEGPMRPLLQRVIDEVGLSDRAHLLGNISDVQPYYHACDLFVLPSVTRNEAFGIVQLEAMACGKPVINTNLDSGVPFVSRDGESGLTVPPGDTPALAAALTTLLSDAGMRTRFGEAARARVSNDFTAEKMVERTLRLYRKVAAGEPVKANGANHSTVGSLTTKLLGSPTETGL